MANASVKSSKERIGGEKEQLSKICKVRRSVESDIDWITTMILPESYNFFGEMNVPEKVRTCFATMVAENEEGDIVSAAILADYPNIPAVPKSDWLTWLHNLYKLYDCNTFNTLWVHCLLSDPQYTFTFMRPLIQGIYLEFPYLLHLMMVSPGGIVPLSFVEGYFSRVVPSGCINISNSQSVYLAFRHHYAKEFKIRRAVEEDNDDLVQIMDTHSDILQGMYGEFYISEILTKHPDINRQLVVAEYKGQAVAVICMNAEVNIAQLNKSFELEPYNFLSKFNLEETEAYYKNKLRDEIEQWDSTSNDSSEVSVCSLDISEETQSEESRESSSSSTILDSNFSGFTDLAKPDYDSQSFTKLHPDSSYDSHGMGKNTKTSQTLEEILPEAEFNFEVDYDMRTLHHIFSVANKNAFVIELMAADDELEVEVMCDLLESTFQCFPDCDYCVVTVPQDRPFIPLLNFCVRAVPKTKSTYPQQLYVLHKNAVKPELEVREVRLSDRPQIERLVCYLEVQEKVVRNTLQMIYNPNSKYQTYVMLNKSVIVAFAVLYEELDFDYILFHSKLARLCYPPGHRYDKVGVLHYAVYSPIFQKHARFFLRELHRLSDMTIILYKLVYSDTEYKIRKRPLPGILTELIPVQLVNHPSYRNDDETFQLPDHCFRSDPHFALYVSTPRLCSLPRIDVNSRIVVVGASQTGMSVLEHLFFSFDDLKHVNYNNVTLVYSDKLTTKNPQFEERFRMFVYRGHYTMKYLPVLALRAHTNFVWGRMSEINRRNKYICIDEDSILPYDVLVLACGVQYQSPNSKSIRKIKRKKIDVISMKFSDTFSMYEKEAEDENILHDPCNLFIINTPAQAEKALRLVTRLIGRKRNYNIIIYGASIHAYCCLATLQKMGIPPHNLKFVEPFPYLHEWPSISPFNQPDIDFALQEQIEEDLIKSFRGFYFVDWKLDPSNRYIKSVRFESLSSGIANIECVAMFFYSKQVVSYDTFQAINAAGLVYDGRLVIDSTCRTNDPNIFAAGPMTKYSRKYYAENESHQHYCRDEIGQRLAQQLKATLLPGGLNNNNGDPMFMEALEKDLTVPHFTNPIITVCYLPGDYIYANIEKPGRKLPYLTQTLKPTFGRIVTTGELALMIEKEDPAYFSIHINNRDFVETITCLTKQKIDVHNIIKLWGKHEKLLNNVITRFDLGYITDFYKYFRQPMFYALYYQSFDILVQKIDDLMLRLTEVPEDSLIEDIELLAEECGLTGKLSPEQEQYLLNRFIDSGYQEEITKLVLDYIGDNINYLPMFAHYLITKMIIINNHTSPLFRNLQAPV